MSQDTLQRNSEVPIPASIANQLAERHLSRVAGIARDIHKRLPAIVAIDDLVGAGNLGLVEARRFDAAKGASFPTFARYRVRGAITDSLRRLDPVSRSLRAKTKEGGASDSRLDPRARVGTGGNRNRHGARDAGHEMAAGQATVVRVGVRHPRFQHNKVVSGIARLIARNAGGS